MNFTDFASTGRTGESDLRFYCSVLPAVDALSNVQLLRHGLRNHLVMHPPPRPHARAPFADGGGVVVGRGDVENRERPDCGWRFEVGPFVDARREFLQKRRDGGRWDAAL